MIGIEDDTIIMIEIEENIRRVMKGSEDNTRVMIGIKNDMNFM